VIGTLAVDGWAVTFGTARRRGLSGLCSPHCFAAPLAKWWRPGKMHHYVTLITTIDRCLGPMTADGVNN